MNSCWHRATLICLSIVCVHFHAAMTELSPCDRGCLACISWNSHHLAFPRKVLADFWLAWYIPVSVSVTVPEFHGTWESLQVGGSCEKEWMMRDMCLQKTMALNGGMKWRVRSVWKNLLIAIYEQLFVYVCVHMYLGICVQVYLCLCACLFTIDWRLWRKSAFLQRMFHAMLPARDVIIQTRVWHYTNKLGGLVSIRITDGQWFFPKVRLFLHRTQGGLNVLTSILSK